MFPSKPAHLSLDGPGPRLCAAGLPACWSSHGQTLGMGHEDGLLLLDLDRATWAPLPGIVEIDGSSGAWLALTDDDDGRATAWQLTPQGWVPRAQLPSASDGCRLEGGAIVERGGIERRAARLVDQPSPIHLPMGALRGRIAIAADGIAWADGPDLYRQTQGGRPRFVGSAPGPVTRLQTTDGGHVLVEIANERTLLLPRGLPSRVVPHISDGPALLGAEGVLLQVGSDVLSATWAGEDSWFMGRQLCGSPSVLFRPDDASLVSTSGVVILEGLWPTAATADDDAILGPAGREWSRRDALPGPLVHELISEHILAHEGHVLAVLDGEGCLRGPDGAWGPRSPLPSPFDDPDELVSLRPARGGVVLVGEVERVYRSWSGQVRRGFLPPSRRPSGPPEGWHWNDAGLLLRLA